MPVLEPEDVNRSNGSNSSSSSNITTTIATRAGCSEKDDLLDEPGVEILAKPSRPVTVEPTLAMYFTVNMPSQALVSQFVYAVVSGRNNLTELMEATGQLYNSSSLPCTDDGNSSLYDLQQFVQSRSATWMLCLNIAFSVPAILMIPVYGSYSDGIGRKLPLLLPQIGFIVKCLLFAGTLYFHLPLELLFLGYFLEGVSGAMPTMMMSSMSYLADVYDPAKRTFRIAIIEVSCGLSGALATVAMGYLIKYMGYMYPFFFLVAINCVNLIYTVCWVEEVRRARYRRMVSASMVLNTVNLFRKPDANGDLWPRAVLIMALVFCDTVVVGRWDTLTLYMLNSPLCWDSVLIGIYSAWSSVSSFLGGLILVALAHRKLGDVGVAVVGCLSGMAYCSSLTFSTHTWSMFAFPLLGFATNVPATMVRAMTSKLTPSHDQGALFASLCAAEAVCNLAGDLVFNPIYSATLEFMKGLVFLVMALFIGISLIHILIYGICTNPPQKEIWTKSVNDDHESIGGMDRDAEPILDATQYQVVHNYGAP